MRRNSQNILPDKAGFFLKLQSTPRMSRLPAASYSWEGCKGICRGADERGVEYTAAQGREEGVPKQQPFKKQPSLPKKRAVRIAGAAQSEKAGKGIFLNLKKTTPAINPPARPP